MEADLGTRATKQEKARNHSFAPSWLAAFCAGGRCHLLAVSLVTGCMSHRGKGLRWLPGVA